VHQKTAITRAATSKTADVSTHCTSGQERASTADIGPDRSARAAECYLGVGLARQDRVKDDPIAVVCVDINVDDRPRSTLASKQVLTIDGFQRCLGQPN